MTLMSRWICVIISAGFCYVLVWGINVFLKDGIIPYTNTVPSMDEASKQQEKTQGFERNEVQMCTQLQRRDHILKMCNGTEEGPPWTDPRYIFDEKRKLLFCEISKSGCTTWKALWKHANNPSMSLEKYQMSPRTVHEGPVDNGLELKLEFPPKDAKQAYTKFLVVRHPFDRVVSAYYNIKRWQALDPGPEEPFKKHLSQKFQLSYTGAIPNLQFEQFLQYVTDPELSGMYYNDRHIAPYSQSCGICDLSYDYVLRLETWEDARPVFQLLGYPENFSYGNFTLHKKQDKTNTVKKVDKGVKQLKEFRDIPHDLIDKLYKKYYFDLELFGYHYDRDTRMASCSIETSDGQKCC